MELLVHTGPKARSSEPPPLVLLTVLGLLAVKFGVADKEVHFWQPKYPPVIWYPEYPMFHNRTRPARIVVQMHDSLDFFCPDYLNSQYQSFTGPKKRPTDYGAEEIFMVNGEDYQQCFQDDAKERRLNKKQTKLLLRCPNKMTANDHHSSRPNNNIKAKYQYTVSFRMFSPMPKGPEFSCNHEYYFLDDLDAEEPVYGVVPLVSPSETPTASAAPPGEEPNKARGPISPSWMFPDPLQHSDTDNVGSVSTAVPTARPPERLTQRLPNISKSVRRITQLDPQSANHSRHQPTNGFHTSRRKHSKTPQSTGRRPSNFSTIDKSIAVAPEEPAEVKVRMVVQQLPSPFGEFPSNGSSAASKASIRATTKPSKRVLEQATGGYRTGAKPPKKQPKERKDALNRAIRNLIEAAQQNSIRGQARKQGIDRSAISREMKKRGIKVYRKVIRPFITEAQKVARKRCAQRFRKRYRKSDIPNFVFVDECYVLVEEYFNSQQERCYGKSFELIPDSKKHKRLQKSPLKAMIFGGVWRDGRTRLIVRPSGFKINQATYQDRCLKPMLYDLKDKLDPREVIFYQDKAPCHVAKTTQSKPSLVVRKNNNPPNSPDLNPLDYGIWSALKARLGKHKIIRNFEQLRKVLIKKWKALPEELIRDTVDSWLGRCRAVENSDGNYVD
ncbi:hypothetical protein RvY_00386 [Ramazzottius varieornatus]|uniref:Ephrin RBD domain-containing protein n=1 Tax=Ramazzottius varieornatus TaxID=947166 RepID=A0A1D1UD20_RAMVA|nr:hypothetical protein RvY_00386 [Ramazzottius varieornatus]